MRVDGQPILHWDRALGFCNRKIVQVIRYTLATDRTPTTTRSAGSTASYRTTAALVFVFALRKRIPDAPFASVFTRELTFVSSMKPSLKPLVVLSAALTELMRL